MEPKVFSNDQLADLTRWLKVICEPNRLLLLEQIIEGVQCNCELGDALQMAPNLISHHLGVLRESGLVDVERDPIDAPLGLLLDQPQGHGRTQDGLWRFLQ